MHRHEMAGVEGVEDLQGFGRVHMIKTHKPARFIGSDGQYRHINLGNTREAASNPP